MNCSPFDLRDYFFEELGQAEKRQVEAHVRECNGCREELDRMRSTQQSLLRLKEEEMPRRIAFVSDKVFEPSWLARWWPRLALAAASGLVMFVAGAQTARHDDARLVQAMQAMEARHRDDMQNVEQAYELLVKQMNVLYRQSVEVRPAVFRQ